jgi:hypothetical protein
MGYGTQEDLIHTGGAGGTSKNVSCDEAGSAESKLASSKKSFSGVRFTMKASWQAALTAGVKASWRHCDEVRGSRFEVRG